MRPNDLLLVAIACALPLASTAAQEREALRVFLDCQSLHCDFDHLRREIGFVNWVRDREVAQIHVLGVSQQTGSGGREVTLNLVGRGRFVGRVDTLRFVTNTTDTDSERRDALTRALALGLVRFTVGTPIADRIEISYEAPSVDLSAGPTHDPWNFWVFEFGAGGSIRGEEQQRNYSGNGRIQANRVTEVWKLNLFGRARYSRSEFELDETETFINTSRSIFFAATSVWSLGPHWSAGFLVRSNTSTFANFDLSLDVGPAVEFSLYPYSESTRREITVQYTLSVSHFNYEEITIFDKEQETLPRHILEISVGAQQPWGNVFGRLEAGQFLDDLDKHRIELFGGFNLRVFRGLRLNLFASVARVKDQINLPAEDLSPEERLLRRRQLGTDFEYNANLSFSYTFGSIFNNIVNPRF